MKSACGGRGGHGHNDILSFELFMDGFNVVTDCGAYLYTASREWRNRFRSTAFHNTVQVDDEELNRFLAPDALWQLHYDAMPVDAALSVGHRVDAFAAGTAATSGWRRRCRTRARCVRRPTARRACSCAIALAGTGVAEFIWRFHLDPGSYAGGRRLRHTACRAAAARSGCCRTLLPPAWRSAIEDGWVSPSYGVKVPATVLVWKVDCVCREPPRIVCRAASVARRRVRSATLDRRISLLSEFSLCVRFS